MTPVDRAVRRLGTAIAPLLIGVRLPGFPAAPIEASEGRHWVIFGCVNKTTGSCWGCDTWSRPTVWLHFPSNCKIAIDCGASSMNLIREQLPVVTTGLSEASESAHRLRAEQIAQRDTAVKELLSWQLSADARVRLW